MATKTTTESARNDTRTARTPNTWAAQARAFAERSLREIMHSRIMLFWTFGFLPGMYLLYTEVIGNHVVVSELFSDGGEVRGFLRADCEVSDIEAVIGDTAWFVWGSDAWAVVETEPTYTDLFNYYTKLELSEAH